MGVGDSSALNFNPYFSGTQMVRSQYDTDPTRPGTQVWGSPNAIPHYSSIYDTNPYMSGTQTAANAFGGYGLGYGYGSTGGYGSFGNNYGDRPRYL